METSVNNKCKAFTSFEQSKRLAEILPIESADMAWCNNSIGGVNYTDTFSSNLYTVKEMREAFDEALRGWDKYWELIPCWSLAALLNVLPDYTLQTNSDGTVFLVCDSKKPMISDAYNNPVDACVEIVLKLHELKML